jgi:putative endonuclease
MSESHSLGQKGENAAISFLEKAGYKIHHRNWKSGKRELDIVAEKNDFIVFVEVKTRTNEQWMDPRDLITHAKRTSMIYSANGYIQKYNINKESRFDVIILMGKSEPFKIDHIENAFYPTLR